MTDRSKEILIAELPKTQQAKIDYYFYGKRQMKAAHKLLEKMDFLCLHLEQELGDVLLHVIKTRKEIRDE